MPKKVKVLLTRKLHDFALKELRTHYSIEVHSGKIPIPKKKLIEKIKDKEGLICFPYDIVDKEVIESAKKLRAISTYSVGYDQIDVKHAKKKKILIGYTPEVLTEATADLTFSLILDLLRRVSEGDRIIRNGKWKQIYGANDYVGTDLSGKTLGILGLGRIGQAVAKRAAGFGMKIIYHNRKHAPRKIETSTDSKFVSINNLLKKSDVISVHVPYTKQTHHLVDIKFLKKMKKSAFFVNTARGKIIKEKDLVLALRNKIIAGAALDVFENEPIGKSHPLTKIQNVVLAPHIGSSTIETRKKMAELTVKNLQLALSGKKPIYSV
ncbi:MAG TPA: D-glycerate dehydrogenase [Nitrosopumilaceae archaeon]|nr:D-glycerate dehydrogenase [Nitrosopumilaceae archaeon]